MNAIEVKNLVKEYKNGVLAINDLSFIVKQGEIFTLLGQNGAGKSSLINILTTFYDATSGSVYIFELDSKQNPIEIRKLIACVAQRTSIDEHLTLKENMIFQSKLYDIEKSVASKRIHTLIESFGLTQYLNYPVSSYSGGIKRRLDIAMNMISNPKILFLDEPTVGMDIISRRAMWDIVKKIRNEFGTTIFLTTHYLEEAEQLSDSICIIHKGHEVVQGTPTSLKKYIKLKQVKVGFETHDQAKACKNIMLSKEEFENSKVLGLSLLINTKSGVTLRDVNYWLLDNHIAFTLLEDMQPSIEDVFVSFTDNRKVDL